MEDEEQTVRLKANFVISAFGSGLSDQKGAWLGGNTNSINSLVFYGSFLHRCLSLMPPGHSEHFSPAFSIDTVQAKPFTGST